MPLDPSGCFNSEGNILHAHTTLTTKEDIEESILHQNQRHSKEVLSTPLCTNPILREAIGPTYSSAKFEELFNGRFMEEFLQDSHIIPTKAE
jgi:hypothetical protein